MVICCFVFNQKTAYVMRISDWSSDVCSSDLVSARWRAAIRSVRLSSAQSSGADDDMRRSKPAVVSNAPPLRHPRCRCARMVAAQLALADRHEQCDRECVTGDQAHDEVDQRRAHAETTTVADRPQTGRASCRESVCKSA